MNAGTIYFIIFWKFYSCEIFVSQAGSSYLLNVRTQVIQLTRRELLIQFNEPFG